MNDHTSLEEQLHGLAEYLHESTNLAPRVMREVERIAADGIVGRSALPPAGRIPRRVARYAAASGVAAAALVVILFLCRNWQSVAWAQVVKAVAQKPWLHAVTTLPDGKKGELWFSASRAIVASKGDKMWCWADGKQQSRTYYDPAENTILRVPDEERREGVDLFEATFRALLSSDAGRTIEAGRFRLVPQQQRSVEEKGKRWIEHRFALHEEAGQHEGESVAGEWVVYVDSDTKLPFRWEQWVHSKEGNPLTSCFEIDFPETGPADIYAFGVPRGVKVVDRLVDPSRPDAKRLMAGVRAARWRSDRYFALVVEGGVDQHWSRCFPSYRVWRIGARWRVERSFGFEVRTDKLFPQDVDPAKWWTRKAETVQFVPGEVCDGKWLLTSMDATRRLAFPPGTEEGGHIHMIDNHPEYLARPLPPLTPLDEVKVNPKPTSGPPNTVLLEVHAAHPQPGHHGPQIWRYWIDPEQGHLVMRYEELVLREGKEEIIRGHAIEGVTQDPGGQWYPTVIRLFKRNILVGSDKPHDGIMRCYYDFVTPMPDSLFKVD